MSNAYAYQHCQPKYTQSATESTVSDPSLFYPNPFAPHLGAQRFCSNNLLLQDADMRRRAMMQPLDNNLREMIKINPEPQL